MKGNQIYFNRLYLFPSSYSLWLCGWNLVLVKCLKFGTDNYNIFEYISYASCNTRSSTSYKYSSSNTSRHQYFNRIVTLWNVLSPIDIPFSYLTNKMMYTRNYGMYFSSNSPRMLHVPSTCLCPCSKCHVLCANYSITTLL